MKRTMISILSIILVSVLCVGCAASPPPAEPEQAHTASPTMQPTEPPSPEPTPAPTKEPKYEIILMDAPEDLVVEERYIPVPYVDEPEIENTPTDESLLDEPVTLDEVIETSVPDFTVYYFEDADGKIQYRAYGEKWLVPDGEEAIEMGMYDILVKRGAMAWDMEYIVEPDAQPIPIEQDFPQDADAAATAAKETAADSTGGKAVNMGADGNTANNSNTSNGGNNAPGGNKDSGGSASTPDPNAGKTWHDAIYEDVWVVDEPVRTIEEPVYATVERNICNQCNADITGNEVAHDENHMTNGGGGGWHSEVKTVQTGTKAVTIPEKGHWEKRLVREAGYY